MPLQAYSQGVPHDVFQVLSDPTRRRLLELLAHHTELSVSGMVEAVEASQPTVSKHLKVLRDGGLVRTRSEGQRRLYSMHPEPLLAAAEWVAHVHDAAVAVHGGVPLAPGPEEDGERPDLPEPQGPVDASDLASPEGSADSRGSEDSRGQGGRGVYEDQEEPADESSSLVHNVGRTVESVTEKAQTFFQRFGRKK